MVEALVGHETATVDLGYVEVTVVLDAGPRILGYARHGGPQLFAMLSGAVIEHAAIGSYAFLGGHRLWRAPEVPAVTYKPDDHPVAMNRFEDGLEIAGPPDADGITKTIALRQRGNMTVVDHTLRNEGLRPILCAAWAITQLSPGGTAVLPHSLAPADEDGVLPNRSVIMWPYTDPSAPEVEFRSSELRIHASRRPTRAKLGQANTRGWVAYLLGGELFVTWSPLHREALDYPDLGSSIECYLDERFLELESLGPLTDLGPGESIHHREVWMLRALDASPLDEVLASLPSEPPEMVE